MTDQTPITAEPMFRIRSLSKHFANKPLLPFTPPTRVVRAVDKLAFDIHRGETLGLVGESGCGKTTTSRLLIRLLDATSGDVTFDGKPLLELKGQELRAFRRQVQIVFQDPFGSLNPRMTAEQVIAEPLITSTEMTATERRARVAELLDLVGLAPEHASRYPHQFSGGQRQRIGIARALALNPKFLVCDEPVSALDLSIQAQIVNLLKDIQRDLGLTVLFVAHDLQVVRHISDRVGVMYLGRMVELADSDTIFDHSRHPYTRTLLSSAPRLRHEGGITPDTSDAEQAEIPSPLNPPTGCHFHPRCALATDRCRSEVPEWRNLKGDHMVLCHHAEQLEDQ
ncbi:oligopeptide/dipeptide ABC transporter ATP-binding protein [Phaeobacter sp. J2-8]|uniref:ABC transporter ATP-binding protein n=1 Tax=Phaeobacter sp. J2-8 TaxID=2931394 RepID=UPI002457DC80|nr:oligopeptide/dipeptide ABC transporter ATP-binding protein [Phaeobacter sp. J2-8]